MSSDSVFSVMDEKTGVVKKFSNFEHWINNRVMDTEWKQADKEYYGRKLLSYMGKDNKFNEIIVNSILGAFVFCGPSSSLDNSEATIRSVCFRQNTKAFITHIIELDGEHELSNAIETTINAGQFLDAVTISFKTLNMTVSDLNNPHNSQRHGQRWGGRIMTVDFGVQMAIIPQKGKDNNEKDTKTQQQQQIMSFSEQSKTFAVQLTTKPVNIESVAVSAIMSVDNKLTANVKVVAANSLSTDVSTMSSNMSANEA